MQDSVSTDSPIVLDDVPEYSYSIKVIDRSKRGTDNYKIHKLRISKKFSSASEIKDQLMKSLKSYVPESDEFDIGYIEPSKQGVRGKMRWIFGNEDADDMYAAYDTAKKTEVIIWCEGRKLGGCGTSRTAQKRPASDNDEGPQRKASCTTVAEKNSRKLEEVEAVYTIN